MPNRGWLTGLHMRVAGHDDTGVLLCQVEQALLELERHLRDSDDFVARFHAGNGGSDIVTAASRVQLAADFDPHLLD